MRITKFLASACIGLTAVTAHAAPVLLTFEGVGSESGVDQFYNGGQDSGGASGIDFGVSFSGAFGSIDSDAGGNGNIANEPSASTVIFFDDDAGSIKLNASKGFKSSLGFSYSSLGDASVLVFDGVGLTGNVIGSVNLTGQATDGCGGDPGGTFCNWTPVVLSFAGTGRSALFTGTAFKSGYDNISFRDLTESGAAPEPATWAMMIAGFGLIGAAMRSRRKVTVRFA